MQKTITANATVTPNALCACNLPTGEFAQVLLGDCLDTHLGRAALPGFDVSYLDLTNVGGFQVCGQAQVEATDSRCGTWLWRASTGQWTQVSQSAHGVYPAMFDAQGQVHLATPEYNGSQGWRYLAEDGQLVTGDDTVNAQRRIGLALGLKDMWEYSHLGGVTIGQGESGCDVIFKGTRSQMLAGDTRFIRVHYGVVGGVPKWAVSTSLRVPFQTQRFVLTEADLAEIAPPTTPPPVATGSVMLKSFERPMWVTPFFSHSTQYGDTPAAEFDGNAIWTPTGEENRIFQFGQPMVVCASHNVPSTVLNNTIAWWVSGATVTALNGQIDLALTLPEKPIIAYLDQQLASNWNGIRLGAKIWPSVQAYRNGDESLGSFQVRVEAMLNRLMELGAPYLSLTPAFYTRNGAVTVQHIVDCMGLYEKWVWEYPIVSFMPFADRRPTGMSEHPELAAWAKAFHYAAALGRPNRFDYWKPDGSTPAAILKNKLGQTRDAVVLEPYLRKIILDSVHLREVIVETLKAS